MDAKKTRKAVKATKATILSTPSYGGTEPRLRVFIEQYIKLGRVHRACEIAGIDHATHYRKLKIDPDYRAAFEEAQHAAAQRLEDRVYEMAVDGELHAALALLRRFWPQLYRDRASLEVSGSIDLVERIKAAEQRLTVLRQNELPALAS